KTAAAVLEVAAPAAADLAAELDHRRSAPEADMGTATALTAFEPGVPAALATLPRQCLGRHAGVWWTARSLASRRGRHRRRSTIVACRRCGAPRRSVRAAERSDAVSAPPSPTERDDPRRRIMYVVCVSVHVKPEFTERFLEATLDNARYTRKEPVNMLFDVVLRLAE